MLKRKQERETGRKTGKKTQSIEGTKEYLQHIEEIKKCISNINVKEIDHDSGQELEQKLKLVLDPIKQNDSSFNRYEMSKITESFTQLIVHTIANSNTFILDIVMKCICNDDNSINSINSTNAINSSKVAHVLAESGNFVKLRLLIDYNFKHMNYINNINQDKIKKELEAKQNSDPINYGLYQMIIHDYAEFIKRWKNNDLQYNTKDIDVVLGYNDILATITILKSDYNLLPELCIVGLITRCNYDMFSELLKFLNEIEQVKMLVTNLIDRDRTIGSAITSTKDNDPRKMVLLIDYFGFDFYQHCFDNGFDLEKYYNNNFSSIQYFENRDPQSSYTSNDSIVEFQQETYNSFANAATTFKEIILLNRYIQNAEKISTEANISINKIIDHTECAITQGSATMLERLLTAIPCHTIKEFINNDIMIGTAIINSEDSQKLEILIDHGFDLYRFFYVCGFDLKKYYNNDFTFEQYSNNHAKQFECNLGTRDDSMKMRQMRQMKRIAEYNQYTKAANSFRNVMISNQCANGESIEAPNTAVEAISIVDGAQIDNQTTHYHLQ